MFPFILVMRILDVIGTVLFPVPVVIVIVITTVLAVAGHGLLGGLAFDGMLLYCVLFVSVPDAVMLSSGVSE